MLTEKIKIAFIYKPCPALTTNYYFTTNYNFFMKALQRNSRIDVTYIETQNIYDARKLQDKFDIILLFENRNNCEPDEFIGLDDLDIPIIAKVGDPYAAKKIHAAEYHKKFNISAYFCNVHESYFYRYYPKKYKFKTILYGLEPSLYNQSFPFENRIKNKILNSGATANMKYTSRLISRLLNPHGDAFALYKLRTLCNRLPYVDYTSTLEHEYVGDKYPQLLQKYAAAIAATTIIPTMKYYEIPAAGCLTFMEVTKKNNAEFLGFQDNETAIFIDENNYEHKFKEYLNDVDNPKWKKIANQGKQYALSNLSNDVAVNVLVDLMEELL